MLIYKATFPNQKSYIGKGRNCYRLKDHKNESYNTNNSAYNTIFHKAIRKYGWENVKWEILEDDIRDGKLLSERETFNILKYDTFMPNGYNMTLGGEGSFGYKHNQTSLKQMLKNQIHFDRECIICKTNFKGHHNQKVCFNKKCRTRYNVIRSTKYQFKNKEKILKTRKDNIDKIRKRGRDFYHRNKNTEIFKDYIKNNKKQRKENQRKWYLKNREQILKKLKEQYKNKS